MGRKSPTRLVLQNHVTNEQTKKTQHRKQPILKIPNPRVPNLLHSKTTLMHRRTKQQVHQPVHQEEDRRGNIGGVYNPLFSS